MTNLLVSNWPGVGKETKVDKLMKEMHKVTAAAQNQDADAIEGAGNELLEYAKTLKLSEGNWVHDYEGSPALKNALAVAIMLMSENNPSLIFQVDAMRNVPVFWDFVKFIAQVAVALAMPDD